ncbi:D-alanyl-D-alanine carboxypeptidase family protein [Mannheimia pernigra]|uniref:D-alanyl-D-alanine carboxypeptidase family protein n=1 Tax=Mannheimia pernigra TaxID=111844 RepID=UPI001317DC8C|nr:serine hydrolase [Mannheimia pernigra]QHB16632.1 D-alanyl-D-alanine carboxypeptidase [Mannheimia pernigra]
MKKCIPVIMVAFLLSACSSQPSTPPKSSPRVKATVATIPADNLAYVVFDLKQKKFLEGRNVNLVLPIASVTKLMTAVVFLEENRYGENCQTQILPSDADFIKGTTSPLPKNTNIACSELLKAMLVRSDNYAAHSLAHATHLNKAQFLARMNSKAKEIGMTQTYFGDSSGLSSYNVSTVVDLAKLAGYATSKLEIQQLSNSPLVSVYAGGRYFSMKNTNSMVRTQSYQALVSKTGYTREAGYNLTFIAKGDCKGKQIGVVSLHNNNATSRAYFTEAMLAKYQCVANPYRQYD